MAYVWFPYLHFSVLGNIIYYILAPKISSVILFFCYALNCSKHLIIRSSFYHTHMKLFDNCVCSMCWLVIANLMSKWFLKCIHYSIYFCVSFRNVYLSRKLFISNVIVIFYIFNVCLFLWSVNFYLDVLHKSYFCQKFSTFCYIELLGFEHHSFTLFSILLFSSFIFILSCF